MTRIVNYLFNENIYLYLKLEVCVTSVLCGTKMSLAILASHMYRRYCFHGLHNRTKHGTQEAHAIICIFTSSFVFLHTTPLCTTEFDVTVLEIHYMLHYQGLITRAVYVKYGYLNMKLREANSKSVVPRPATKSRLKVNVIAWYQ